MQQEPQGRIKLRAVLVKTQPLYIGACSTHLATRVLQLPLSKNDLIRSELTVPALKLHYISIHICTFL